MKCPYCGKEMKKGKVKIGDTIGNLLKAGEVATYIPEEECGKLLPKNTLNLDINAEGFYCDACKKVVAVFSERGDSFFQ